MVWVGGEPLNWYGEILARAQYIVQKEKGGLHFIKSKMSFV